MATQYDIVRFDSVESTQDHAKRLVAKHERAVLVVAQRQTVGRGRQGREWLQPDRGLFASYGFVSDWKGDDATLIPLVAAVAMRSAVSMSLGIGLGLRWPNDLMTTTGKVGGILVEASGLDVVVGCGLNLWWPEPADGAAALLPDDPGPEVGATLAETWADQLSTYMAGGAASWPRAEYESASVTLGRTVNWGSESGTALEIALDGALVVDQSGDRIVIRAGEVHTHDER